MHTREPTRNSDAKSPPLILQPGSQSLCTQTGGGEAQKYLSSWWKIAGKKKKKNVFSRKLARLDFRCKRHRRWGETACHSLEMWALIIWRQTLGEYINIYISTTLFLVNLSSIRRAMYNFMTWRERKTKQVLREIGRSLNVEWKLHNLFCWHFSLNISTFYKSKNNIWSAERAKAKRPVAYPLYKIISILNLTLNTFSELT